MYVGDVTRVAYVTRTFRADHDLSHRLVWRGRQVYLKTANLVLYSGIGAQIPDSKKSMLPDERVLIVNLQCTRLSTRLLPSCTALTTEQDAQSTGRTV